MNLWIIWIHLGSFGICGTLDSKANLYKWVWLPNDGHPYIYIYIYMLVAWLQGYLVILVCSGFNVHLCFFVKWRLPHSRVVGFSVDHSLSDSILRFYVEQIWCLELGLAVDGETNRIFHLALRKLRKWRSNLLVYKTTVQQMRGKICHISTLNLSYPESCEKHVCIAVQLYVGYFDTYKIWKFSIYPHWKTNCFCWVWWSLWSPSS